MKLAIIGGAGVRTPLLVNGLCRSDVPIREIALYDTDLARLDVVGRLAARVASPTVGVTTHSALDPCVADAAFVFISIRVGGIDSRAHDERVSLAHGILGQETVGPAGFAMALRSIPAVVAYARRIAELAPGAWIVNFTNPVGMVTDALHRAGCSRAIGICDTPTELFEDVAHALGRPTADCTFDYLGLNHLGWLREVYVDGRPALAPLWSQPERLAALHRAPLFAPSFLADLRLLPTEYLVYYYRPADVRDNMQRAGRSRGAVVSALSAELFADLGRVDIDPVTRYETYLAARSAGYMQIESGASAPLTPSPWAALTGYDKIALAVVRAIHFNTGALIPLDVPNRGAIRDLDDDDVVEVPCVVNANGAWPLATGSAPAHVRDLLRRVRAYERATVEAAMTGDRASAIAALASNPLVSGRDVASALVDALDVPCRAVAP